MAVDQKLLLENLLKQNKRTDYIKPVLSKIDQLKKQTVTINEAIGTAIFVLATPNNDKDFLAIMSNQFCERWEKESGTNETKYIIKKALRTITRQ